MQNKKFVNYIVSARQTAHKYFCITKLVCGFILMVHSKKPTREWHSQENIPKRGKKKILCSPLLPVNMLKTNLQAKWKKQDTATIVKAAALQDQIQ